MPRDKYAEAIVRIAQAASILSQREETLKSVNNIITSGENALKLCMYTADIALGNGRSLAWEHRPDICKDWCRFSGHAR